MDKLHIQRNAINRFPYTLKDEIIGRKKKRGGGMTIYEALSILSLGNLLFV